MKRRTRNIQSAHISSTRPHLHPPLTTYVHLFVSLKPILTALRLGNRTDIFSLSIALATFLAKSTPILFSSIPYRDFRTLKDHAVSIWMAVGRYLGIYDSRSECGVDCEVSKS